VQDRVKDEQDKQDEYNMLQDEQERLLDEYIG